ncbi:hypothetical protein C0J52_09551 [Blattella germanica]|nr:hypothetical protein C0J52_09551 [Blattella germanica]
MKGYALSAYYYGYVATQLLGGRLSEVIGSKFVLGPGVFVAGLVTLLSPLAAKLHISAFIAARVLAGAASGVVIPSTNYMLTNWIIPEEMSLILGFMLSGSPVGTCLSMILSGVLADAGGWPLVFYFFGCLGVLFIIPWMFLAYDSPNSHPRISETEKEFILNNTANKDKDNTKAALSVPWLAILTSGPMWIHILMCCGYSWVGYTMLSELPSYLSKMLHFDLQSIDEPSSGYGACAALIAITFVGCDSTVIVVLLVCTLFMVGMFHGGSFFNHVDLGSNYTGTLAGIFFTLSNSMGILAPTITGLMINEQVGKFKRLLNENMYDKHNGLFSCIPARYVIAAMCFLSIFVEYVMKVCLSVVIVAMAGQETSIVPSGLNITGMIRETSSDDVCPGSSSTESDSQVEPPEFDWDSSLQGHILSSQAYGIIATHMISGRLSEILGAKHVLGFGVLFTSIFTILCPVAARWDVAAFITLRVLVGASSGFILPSVHVLIAKWFPPEERYSMSSLIISAIPLSTVVAMSVSGILAEAAGWPLVFYLFGGFGVLWYVPWLLVGFSSPETHPRISEEEKRHIAGKQEEKKVALPVPWIAILTSLPLWAHTLMSFGYSWIEWNHFCFAISPFTFFWNGIRDYITEASAKWLLVTPQCCPIVQQYNMMAVGGYCGGSLVNHLDLGSNFAGTTSGISTTLSSVAAILTPVITGELTSENKTLTQWSIVFYISVSITLAGYVFFMIFGSVEEQPWNKPMNKKPESQEP